ncbi:MAG: hypothetical protein L0322_27015, partial [Chloroflexi bacterium]|nr:hypothetical protein [Chloroflexota bacterium]
WATIPLSPCHPSPLHPYARLRQTRMMLVLAAVSGSHPLTPTWYRSHIHLYIWRFNRNSAL